MADTQNMALDQATEEHRFFDLYQKALKCGVYREAEYLCDLVLHEYAVKKPMPAVFKPLTSTAPLSRAFCESTNQQLLWQWRRYRALFLQQRYSVLLLELDQRFAEVFLCWAAARQSSKTIGPGTSWAQALYSTKEHTSLIFRCAFLKVLALEALQKNDKALEFADDVIRQCTLTSYDTEDCAALDHSLMFNLKCRLLGVQGRILEAEKSVDLAVSKYVEAVKMNFGVVPWVLSRLIGTRRLSRQDQCELLNDLASQRSSQSSSHMLAGYENFVAILLRDTLFVTDSPAQHSFSYCFQYNSANTLNAVSKPLSLLEIPIILELLAQQYLNTGLLDNAEAVARRGIAQTPLNFSCIRILAEVLSVTCWDKPFFSASRNFENTVAPAETEQLKRRLEELEELGINLKASFPSHPVTLFCFAAASSRIEYDAPKQRERFQLMAEHPECPDALLPYYIESLIHAELPAQARNELEALAVRQPRCPVTAYQFELLQIATDIRQTDRLVILEPDASENIFFAELRGDKAIAIERWDTAYTAYRSCLVKALCVETASDPEDTVNAFFDLCTQSETPPNKLFVAASANEQLDRFDMNDSVPSVYRVAVLVVRVAIKLTAVSSLLKITNATAKLLCKVFGRKAMLSTTEQLFCVQKFWQKFSAEHERNACKPTGSRNLFRFFCSGQDSCPKPFGIIHGIVGSFLEKLLDYVKNNEDEQFLYTLSEFLSETSFVDEPSLFNASCTS